MPLSKDVLFSFDSSSLIHAWNRAYRPTNFPSFWNFLEQAINAGVVVASVEVLNELSKKDDAVYEWCKRVSGQLCVDIDDEQQEHLQHVMGTYPRLVDTVKGRSGGDPFVIALARVRLGEIAVVSEEDFGRRESPRIPDVCEAFELECIELDEFLRRLGLPPPK